MSHNVKLAGVKFANLDILRAALEELIGEGANVQLVTGGGETFRGWQGSLHKADAVIKCPSSQYDVGLKWNGDAGVYEPILENLFRDAHLSAAPGSRNVEGAACIPDGSQYRSTNLDHLLGRLTQRYAVINTEINAAKQGKKTNRINDATTGQIHLEVVY